MKKKILVDLSCTLIHHGHIRLLKKASKFGEVIVALTTDKEVFRNKGYFPELKFQFRKEVLESVKYVKKVIPSKWKINNKFLKKNKIDIIIRGSDYKNEKFFTTVKIFPRTKNISSTILRKKSNKIYDRIFKKNK